MISRLNAKPSDPQELDWLGRVFFDCWVSHRNGGMINTQYLGVPVQVGFVACFWRQNHDIWATGNAYCVMVPVNVVCGVVDRIFFR